MTEPVFPTEESTPLTLDGPAGAIEVIVEAAEAHARPLVAVLCHPLPTEGGTMHNKVVTIAARALRESGAATVRFNFRGVGQSEGTFDDGNGEADDLRAVVAWVRRQRPDAQLWLAGFSFGAYVSLKVAAELKPDMLISIAPPAGRGWEFDAITPPDCPWLVIQGEADEIVDPAAVYAWLDGLKGLKNTPELVRMPETSHFFHRRLMDLRGAVKNGVRPYLPAVATMPDD
ncbi:alpha/beta hydrolase [Novilysobacter selenitireducens]|uniref:Alpha/beta fold hydrolase n=1 Tax=Novilysobacter selenitireducens TaxID=2872639 RepID=A0ABS7T241_9GAMM|nr:alpha/beta fold hydrolase [Lysobacter selenitireducens]MBZ4037939.1 alpha/beta fold hydrolase [Lysobacter selenitireducens]